MFALPGTILLILTIYLRPQEIFPVLQSVPLLHVFMALAIFGIVVDWRLRLSRPTATPQLVWAVLFTAWCAISLVAKAPPDGMLAELVECFIPLALFLIVAHGIQTLRALQTVAATLLVVCLVLAGVGIDQRMSDKGCHVLTGESTKDGIYDGRPCETVEQCVKEDPEPGADYTCEYVGPVGTSSVGLRVRYRGVLADPNELALAMSVALPFAFAFFERRRSLSRGLLVALSLGLVGTCVVFTQSRGGQLVMLAVLGTYFVRRYGLKGMVIAGLAAVPMLLLGGRSGAEAEGSSLERLECWLVGTEMFRDNLLMGVGKGMFVEHHFLTAHNSYVLAPAELGLVGTLLWSCLMYVSLKIPFLAVWRSMAPHTASGRATLAPEAFVLPPASQAWSLAMLAAFAGMCVGVFFLSFCYHYVLWTYLGLCGALYTAIRTHDPRFKVRMTLLEVALVLGGHLFLIAAIWAYTRGKV